MATDRDEQLRQQRELEEIRRSFAEMGARMGSLFEPTEADETDEADRAGPPGRPPTPTAVATSPPPAAPARSRWWWAGALVLLFVAGTALGRYVLPTDQGSDASATRSSQTTTASTQPEPTTPSTTTAEPAQVVPEVCLEAAELADEVISSLLRNDRSNATSLALRDFSIANQACREEASP